METNSYSNNTNNGTQHYDIFCAKMFVGPFVLAIFSVPCVCVGLLAGMWLLFVLVQRQRNGLANDVYMVNLTVMDLIHSIFRILVLLNFSVWRDRIFLDLCFFMEGFNMNGRPLFMACVCVDCYMAVVHPISYMRIKNSKYRLVVCALIWITTLLLNLYGLYREFLHVSVRGLSRIMIIATIVFCNIAILCILRKPDPSGKNRIHPQKQRALQAITNSFIMTMVSYLPQTLLSLLVPLIPLSQQEVWCSILLPNLVSSVLGIAIMPLLYLGNLGSLTHLWRAGCGRNV